VNVLGSSRSHQRDLPRSLRTEYNPIRILLVEDDIKAARLIVSELQKEGFVVDLATADNDSEEKATASEYDLIVLDRARTPSTRGPRAFDTFLARVTALLRHSRRARVAAMSVADLTLDPASRRATRAGVEIALTAKEYAILCVLMQSAGEVVSRTRLAELVWEEASTVLDNLIDAHVSHLRRKLARSDSAPLIHTVRGIGYRLGL
jgi:DNA-binding response OmpR family regulator